MNVGTIIVGILALLTWIISLQCKRRSKFLKLQVLANSFYALEYLLLGAYSGAVMNLISVVRCRIYYDNEKSKKDNTKFQLIIFIIITVLFGIITYVDYLSILITMIALCYTISSWQKRGEITRYVYTFGAIALLYYNMNVGAYFFVFGNIVELISGVIAIARIDLKTTKNKKK